jgi:lactoylglutathione lyase
MLPIRGLYEIAIRVRDLAKSEPFYREVLGLEVGLRDERRPWVFLRAGGDAGVIVLQEDAGTWPTQHFAFTVEDADIEGAAAALRGRGLVVKGPVYHAWMPARSVYFSDPDGHDLELCAPVVAAGSAGDGGRAHEN